MAILVHRNNYDDFDTINAESADVLRQVKVGEGVLGHARIYFSGTIHDPHILFKDSQKITRDGRLNIGAVLRYVKDNVFGVKGYGPGIPNLLVVATDDNSDDDVAAPAKALCDAGVLVIFI
ncbi:unnamed protein product [Clavelina lepadiformis]|uniref:VWFA domain-containing protein n=1 Tax=Clavelina lepadiformis TaxID=159417 RepID=A0ABP0FKV4_CLALP